MSFKVIPSVDCSLGSWETTLQLSNDKGIQLLLEPRHGKLIRKTNIQRAYIHSEYLIFDQLYHITFTLQWLCRIVNETEIRGLHENKLVYATLKQTRTLMYWAE